MLCYKKGNELLHELLQTFQIEQVLKESKPMYYCHWYTIFNTFILFFLMFSYQQFHFPHKLELYLIHNLSLSGFASFIKMLYKLVANYSGIECSFVKVSINLVPRASFSLLISCMMPWERGWISIDQLNKSCLIIMWKSFMLLSWRLQT